MFNEFSKKASSRYFSNSLGLARLFVKVKDIFVDPKSLLGLKRWHSCSGWGGLGLQSDVDRFKATRTGGHLNISSKSLHFRARHQSRFGSLPSFQLWIKPTVQLISFIGEKHSSDFCEKHFANSFTFCCFDIYLLAIQKRETKGCIFSLLKIKYALCSALYVFFNREEIVDKGNVDLV